MDNGAGFIALMAGSIFIGLIFLALGIAMYVLLALGLMNLAKNKGVENPWLAWIPFANAWILGQIIETIDVGENKFPNAGWILVGVTVATAVLGGVPVIGGLISIAAIVIELIALFKLFKMYVPEKAVMYLVVSVVTFGVAAAIFIYMIRNESVVTE